MRARTATVAGAVAALVATGGAFAITHTASAESAPARSGDFNGDGFRDLVTISHGDAAGRPDDSGGYAAVVYGSANGPDVTERQVLHRGSPGLPAEGADARYLHGAASADFDRDGYADLVVAGWEPNLMVVYGSESGLSSRTITLRTGRSGVSGVTVGDVDGNGRPDIVTAGAYFNETDDRVVQESHLWTFPNVAAAPVTGRLTATPLTGGDGLAWAVPVAGDFNGDGADDVAQTIASDLDGEPTGQQLRLHLGGPAGRSAPRTISVSRPGSAIAAGDVTGDGKADLVVQRQRSDYPDAGGSFHLLLGTAQGLGTAKTISQNTKGVPGTDEGGEGTGDGFGHALAIGDVNKDGRADVAIGAPYEDIGKVRDAGAVTILYGAKGGLTTTGAQIFGQNTKGVPGAPEQGDEFGRSIALHDVNGGGKADLTVGTPAENGPFTGMIYTFRGTTKGVTTKNLVTMTFPQFTGVRSGPIGDRFLP